MVSYNSQLSGQKSSMDLLMIATEEMQAIRYYMGNPLGQVWKLVAMPILGSLKMNFYLMVHKSNLPEDVY